MKSLKYIAVAILILSAACAKKNEEAAPTAPVQSPTPVDHTLVNGPGFENNGQPSGDSITSQNFLIYNYKVEYGKCLKRKGWRVRVVTCDYPAPALRTVRVGQNVQTVDGRDMTHISNGYSHYIPQAPGSMPGYPVPGAPVPGYGPVYGNGGPNMAVPPLFVAEFEFSPSGKLFFKGKLSDQEFRAKNIPYSFNRPQPGVLKIGAFKATSLNGLEMSMGGISAVIETAANLDNDDDYRRRRRNHNNDDDDYEDEDDDYDDEYYDEDTFVPTRPGLYPSFKITNSPRVSYREGNFQFDAKVNKPARLKAK